MNESTIVAEEKSTHKVEVFVLQPFEKHPNADTLSLIKIGDTDYSYCGRTEDWQGQIGKTVAWIPPDSLVDVSKPEFMFLAAEAKYDKNSNPDKLGGFARIKAKKLRGIVSYGLMVPFEGEPGSNAAQPLNVHHYEPPLDNSNKNGLTGGEDATPPKGVYPKYDVDAFLKYGRKVFQEGEPVFVTEKIHGANSRYVYLDGNMNCGSRNLWKKEFSSPPNVTLEELKARIGDDAKAEEVFNRVVKNHTPKKNLWWVALENTPQLREYCQKFEGYTVYGEVYGQVQKGFNYGIKNGEVAFRAFDILTPDGTWMDADQFLATCKEHGIPHVPVLHENVPFNFDNLVEMAVGNSLVQGATNIREGVVVKPIKERWNEKLGRVNLKIINPAYLEK
jgi:RNA ligase (TIGR02306 family)